MNSPIPPSPLPGAGFQDDVFVPIPGVPFGHPGLNSAAPAGAGKYEHETGAEDSSGNVQNLTR